MLTIEDRLTAANAHLDEGRNESAAQIFESVIDQSPNNVDSLKGLAVAKMQSGEIEVALGHAQRALALAAGRPDVLETFARLQLIAGHEDTAEAALDHALAIDAVHPACCVMKAEMLKYRGAFGKAERLLVSARNAHPENPDVLMGLAGLYIAGNHVDEALQAAQHALELRPDRPDLAAFLGMLLIDCDNPRLALPYLEKAHLQQPGNPHHLVALAEVQASAGELSEARRLIRRALNLFPQSLPVRAAHIRIATLLGEQSEAIAAFVPIAKGHQDKKRALLVLAAAYRTIGETSLALKLVEPLLAGDIQPDLLAKAQNLARDCYLTLGRLADLKEALPKLELEGNETADAVAMRGLAIGAGLSSLEALVLLRFKPAPGVSPEPVNVEASGHLREIVELVEGVRFKTDDDSPSPPLAPFPVSHLLGTPLADLANIAQAVPYVQANKSSRELWSHSLAHLPRPLVALAWDTHRPGILLEDYRLLLSDFTGTLVAVAWDEARHQLANWPEIIDAGVHFQSLNDLAAVLAEVDGVIGPDGIVTHVAGAMGRPCAVLTQPAAPWYWRADGDSRSVWYPSAKVLCAPTFGSWHQLLPALADPVARFLAGLPSRGDFNNPQAFETADEILATDHI